MMQTHYTDGTISLNAVERRFDYGKVVKTILRLFNGEPANKFLLSGHFVGVLCTRVILYLVGVLDDKTLSSNTCVHEFNVKHNSPC